MNHSSYASIREQSQTESGAVKILLTATTRWPAAARLAKEFSAIGHAISIVCPDNNPSRRLRVAPKAFPYDSFTPLDSLMKAIETIKPDFIIPCDDLAVRHLHQLYVNMLRRPSAEVDVPALIVRSLGPPESYAIVDSRYLTLKIAEEEGIRTADTRVIASLDDLNRSEPVQPFPWVLKADGTTGGRGVQIAHTLSEAKRHFSSLSRSIGLMRAIKRLAIDRDLIFERQWRYDFSARLAVVAQSFIRGRPANCAVVCWEGEVLAGVACEAVSTETSTGPATVVRLLDNSEMRNSAAKIARRLQLSGFFGLDFMIEEGTGAAYLIEMNPRCTPPCHLRLGTGRDMVGALSAQLTGKPELMSPSITQNDSIAYFPEALLRSSEFLSSTYHDVPVGETELIQELLQPSASRRVTNLILDYLRAQFCRSRTA